MRLWVVLNLLLLTFSGLAPAWKVRALPHFQMKGGFHVSHSAFIDNHGVLGESSLLLLGKRWQFISPCGSIDNSGVRSGRVGNSCAVIVAWLTQTGFLWHHPWERKGWLFLPGGAIRLPCGLIWTWWGDGDSSLSSRMKVSALMVFPDTTPQKGLSGAYHSFSEWKSGLPSLCCWGWGGRSCSFSCAVV